MRDGEWGLGNVGHTDESQRTLDRFFVNTPNTHFPDQLWQLDSFLETPQTHTTVSAVYRFLVTQQPNTATFEKTRNTHFTTFPSAAAVVTTC